MPSTVVKDRITITLFRPCLVLDGGCLESRPIYRKIGKRPKSGLGTGTALLYACGEHVSPCEFLYTWGDFNPDCALVHLAAYLQLFTT